MDFVEYVERIMSADASNIDAVVGEAKEGSVAIRLLLDAMSEGKSFVFTREEMNDIVLIEGHGNTYHIDYAVKTLVSDFFGEQAGSREVMKNYFARLFGGMTERQRRAFEALVFDFPQKVSGNIPGGKVDNGKPEVQDEAPEAPAEEQEAEVAQDEGQKGRKGRKGRRKKV